MKRTKQLLDDMFEDSLLHYQEMIYEFNKMLLNEHFRRDMDSSEE